jgi:CheY-like chemotaxis protein
VKKKKKPKLLVVDDEPDNLDLLYRTFRREFQVFKAESGADALKILTEEGEVSVIISDQRMPEMKGTEFLKRTVSDFPDTVRIILTGFTDVEDLVDAINSGQVYKYITKPWDPHELKEVVQQASDGYEQIKNRTEELQQAQIQAQLMAKIVQVALKSQNIKDCLDSIALAFGESFSAETCIVEILQDGQLTSTYGHYPKTETIEYWLGNDPLIKNAIASGESQIWNIESNSISLDQVPHYQEANLKTHLVTPILYKDKTLAVISLQWKVLHKIDEQEMLRIHVISQQVALAINSSLSDEL